MAPPKVKIGEFSISLEETARRLIPRGAIRPLELVLNTHQAELIPDKDAAKYSDAEKCRLLQEKKWMHSGRFNKFGNNSHQRYIFSRLVRAELADEVHARLNGERFFLAQDFLLPSSGKSIHEGGYSVLNFFYRAGLEAKLLGCSNESAETIADTWVKAGSCVFKIPEHNIPEAQTIVIPKNELSFYLRSSEHLGRSNINPASVNVRALFEGESILSSTWKEFLEAPRNEMRTQKAQFKKRLQREIDELKRNDSDSSLVAKLEGIRELIDSTPFYEVNAGMVHSIPAFFIHSENDPNGSILFAHGTYSFSLALHEMAHALQRQDGANFEGNERMKHEFDAYNLNLKYGTEKAQISSKALLELSSAALEFGAFQKSGELTEDSCRILEGKKPKIYEIVEKIVDRIDRVPEFTSSEKKSLFTLLLAKYQLRFKDDGTLEYDFLAYEKLLNSFYQEHYHLSPI